MGDLIGISRCDDELCAWARKAVGDLAQVSLVEPAALREGDPAPGPDPAASTEARVEIALIEVRPEPGADAPGLPTLKLRLRYLATVRSADVGRAHAALSALAFAAMSRDVDSLERSVDWMAVWAALGAPLRPSLMISAQAEETRVIERRAPKPVRGIRIIEAGPPMQGGGPSGLAAGGQKPAKAPATHGIEVVRP